MWTPWHLGHVATFGLALLWSFTLALALSRTATQLPSQLDPNLKNQAYPTHRYFRVAFLVVTTLLALLTAQLFGPTPASIFLIVFINTLLALAWIDAETGLLPDRLNLSLLWFGLLVNLRGTFAPLEQAVLGAVIGYVWLWLVYKIFFMLTGKIGLGRGDLKLFAAIGAWLGWTALPWVLLVASIPALAFALTLKLTGRLEPNHAFSFGPYLAAGGIVIMFYMLI